MRQCILYGLRALVAILALAGSAAFAAESNAPTVRKCAKMGLFISIVDLTNGYLNAKDPENYIGYKDLEKLIAAVKPGPLRKHLDQAGYIDDLREIQLYLSDIKRFIHVRNTNGPKFGGWILDKQLFRTRHLQMLVMADNLCETTMWEKFTDAMPSASKQSTDDELSEDKADKKAGAKPLKISAIQPTSKSSTVQFQKKTLLLIRVFVFLATMILAIYVTSYMLKLFRAVRLDRYECAIPATLEIGGVEILGRIDVIGNRGLSFEVTEAPDPVHEQCMVVDRHVKFLTESFEFYAVLTKAFDRNAGFRLSVPLEKSILRQLLLLSETKPRRKLEMGRKKKPATSVLGSLALKNQRSPAE